MRSLAKQRHDSTLTQGPARIAARRSAPFILFCAILLGACAAPLRYSPGAAPQVSIAHDRVSSSDDRLSVTAEHVATSLTEDERLLVFRLAIRNTSSEPVPLSTENISLHDASRRQYAAMIPEEVAATSRGDCYPYYGGMGWGWDGWGWHSGWATGWHWEHDYYCYPEATRLLSESIFPTAPIEPGARLKGLVFFRIGKSKPQSATIVLRTGPGAPIQLPFARDLG